MTPHEQMRAMDLEGAPYEVTAIRFVGDDKTITGNFDVLNHTEEWIELSQDNSCMWIHMSNVSLIKIERFD